MIRVEFGNDKDNVNHHWNCEDSMNEAERVFGYFKDIFEYVRIVDGYEIVKEFERKEN